MGKNHQEIEVKFYLTRLADFEKRVQEMGGTQSQARVHEVNLRFDTPGEDLRRAHQVPRLRRDTAARLTFKGPGEMQGGLRLRQEIEFVVENFEAARAFLEALGYRVVMQYEKYRLVYDLEGMQVALDELPFGHFTEIEGSDPAKIRELSSRLGLDWNAHVAAGYTALFDNLMAKLGLDFRDLLFENFEGMRVTASDLGISAADPLERGISA